MRSKLFCGIAHIAKLLFIFPLVCGICATVALTTNSFLGLSPLTQSAWQELLQWQPLVKSILLSSVIATLSTLLSTLLCFAILLRFYNTSLWRRYQFLLPLFAALPHIAFAIGITMLFAPSGWLFRLLSIFGLDFSIVFVRDSAAIGLILTLALRESPFLLLMSGAVLVQMPVAQLQATAFGLGYSRESTWLKIIFPLWLRGMRLPIAAVFCYGISVVDIGLILAPLQPPPFAVQLWQWIGKGDPTLLPQVAAGGLLLCFVSLLLLAVFGLLLHLFCSGKGMFSAWIYAGRSHYSQMTSLGNRLLKILCTGFTVSLITVFVLAFMILFLWSIAFRFPYPALLPTQWSFQFWQKELSSIWDLMATSLLLGLLVTGIALFCAIICQEYKSKHTTSGLFWKSLLTLPLILPQLPLLFGLHEVSLIFHSNTSFHYFYWVSWSHFLFVFPYIYFTLEGSWKDFDTRYEHCASSLGKNYISSLLHVKIAMLSPIIIFAFAVGMSVSLAQYLPTLMLGAGRVATITTEAIAVTSGNDRRIMAIYGIVQSLLPLLFFIGSILLTRKYNERITGQKSLHYNATT